MQLSIHNNSNKCKLNVFVYMCILSITDTQEAPKSLSLDSGSSLESLASVAHTEKNLVERPRLGGAFASYVRHRGEPDGKTMEPPNVLIPASRQPCQNGGGITYLKVTRCSTRIESLSFSIIKRFAISRAEI